MIKIYTPLQELLFPRSCLICRKLLSTQETYLCIHCMSDIPRTRINDLLDNPVSRLFWGTTNIRYGYSYFYYRKGSSYQEMIHYLKYSQLPQLGEYLGSLAAHEGSKHGLKNIDIIIPVPLHWRRKLKRGYNQSAYIAKGFASILNKPIIYNNLVRRKSTSSQTNKSRSARFLNVDNLFHVKQPHVFKNKHLLLVDDVITTGATMSACYQALSKTEEMQVSFASLAVAQQ